MIEVEIIHKQQERVNQLFPYTISPNLHLLLSCHCISLCLSLALLSPRLSGSMTPATPTHPPPTLYFKPLHLLFTHPILESNRYLGFDAREKIIGPDYTDSIMQLVRKAIFKNSFWVSSAQNIHAQTETAPKWSSRSQGLEGHEFKRFSNAPVIPLYQSHLNLNSH